MSTVACNICGWEGRFLVPERGKEGFICSNCSSASRNRLVTLFLGRLLGQSALSLYTWPRMKEVKVLDLQQFFFESEQFDVVIASDVLEHVRDDEKALREIFRVRGP